MCRSQLLVTLLTNLSLFLAQISLISLCCCVASVYLICPVFCNLIYSLWLYDLFYILSLLVIDILKKINYLNINKQFQCQQNIFIQYSQIRYSWYQTAFTYYTQFKFSSYYIAQDSRLKIYMRFPTVAQYKIKKMKKRLVESARTNQ